MSKERHRNSFKRSEKSPCQGYSLISYESLDNFEETGQIVNKKNLKRVIKVRNINLHRKGVARDFLNHSELKHEAKKEIDKQEQHRGKMVKLGKEMPRIFKNSTVQKFKSVNGVFFGSTNRNI